MQVSETRHTQNGALNGLGNVRWRASGSGYILMMVGAALFALCSLGGHAQTPEQVGLRFTRSSAKTADTLAPKAGGLTERIEIQSTDDHIDYVVKAYPIANANSSELFQLILNAVLLEGGSVDRIASGSEAEVVHPGECNHTECNETDILHVHYKFSGSSFLVVTAPKWMLPYIDQTIETLDRHGLESSAFGTGAVYVKPKHRRPSELAALIADSAASGVEVFVADDSRNLLYLEDTPSYVGGNLEALAYFDIPPDQLEVHVRVYEIDESNSRDVGLDWYSWKKGISSAELVLAHNIPDIKSVTGEMTFNALLATEFLNYLAEQGNAKVITDTRITVVNGESATIQSVLRIPFVLRGFVGNDVAGSPLRDSPEALDTGRLIKEFTEGVTINMTPSIGEVTTELTIDATVTSHVGYTPHQSVPIISSSFVESVLNLETGSPMVLAGLTRTTTVNERTGIPGLMNIAGLRYLFSREVEREHHSQIVITLHPTIHRAGSARTGEIADVPPSL